jgi:hypothetical protein
MKSIQMRGLLAVVSYERGRELPWSEWTQLEEGHCVIVQRDGGRVLSGEVDVVGHDASVFWIWLDGGRGRIAVYPDEGTSVWLPED